ncbi:MAG TPA: type II secretion system protein GspL [Allosphingosinicella sp.]|jgi:general secretion pathway protein L|nr:type II secretion system protein GspL [Allosphingosinicella sp.]
MREALLLFLGRGGGVEGWIRLAQGEAAARGPGIEGADAHRAAPVVAVAPGEEVTLRWLDLPSGLSPAQAAGAARLMAAELSAQPVSELHVAAGRGGEDGLGRCVGLVPVETMRGWLADLESAGFDPERVIPETLLVPAPDDGLAAWDAGPLRLYRGRAEAFAAEPELGDLLLAGRTAVPVGPEAFAAGLAAALDEAPLDLRQGPFARRRDWRVAPARARRLAMLTAALLLISLAVQVALIARYSFAADSADAEARRVAAAALPRSPGLADPHTALTQRLAELRGGGAGFRATAGALFEAVKATPNIELTALAFSPDGLLRATVQADSPAAIEALRQRVEASGFGAEAGPPRSGGGRRVADLTVRPR